MVYAFTSKLAQVLWDSNPNFFEHDLNATLSPQPGLGAAGEDAADVDELAIWGQVLQQVRMATGWAYGEVWLPHGEQIHLHCRGLWHNLEWVLSPLEVAPAVACDEGLPGQTWLTQQPVWSECLHGAGQDARPDAAQERGPDLGPGQEPSVALDWQPSVLLEAGPAVAVAGGLGIPITVAGERLAVLVFGLPQASDRVMAPAAMAIATQAITIVQLQQVQSALAAHYQRQMHLLDALPGIVFCCSNVPQWRLSYLSQGCVDLTGYSRDELLGPDCVLTYSDVIVPQDWDLVTDSVRQAIAQHQPYGVEYRICTKSGEIKWLWEKGRALYDSHGNVLGLEGFITDITERKLVETALQTSKAQNNAREAFLQLILDNIPQQIFWKDQNLIYRGANRQFAQLYGFDSPCQIVGKTDYDLTDPGQAEKWRDRDRSILATGKPSLHIICNKQTAEGHDAWIDMNKVPIYDDAGQAIGILGTLGDFTDRKRAEDTLAKRDRYLTALVEIHRYMLANGDSEHLYADVTQTLGYASGADRVEFYINSRDSDGNLYMSLKSAWNADGIPPSRENPHEQIPYAQFAPAWLQQMSNGDSHSALVKHLPTADRQFCEAQGVLAILELPIIVNGEFVGFIGFDNLHEERVWEPLEVDLLQTAAGAIAIQLERRQAQSALQQAEAKYRSIFENAVEGIFQSTPKGSYITVNPMLARMYGYGSPADLIANMTDIGRQLYVVPQRRDQFAQLLQDYGAVWGFESEVYCKDGSRLWISECARAIYGADGQILYYEGTVEDITRRKTAEAELLNRENLLQGVSQATHSLLTTLNLDEAITEALAILGEAAGVARVCICEHAPHPDTQAPAMTMRYEWVQASIPPSIDQPHWKNLPFSAHGLTRWYRAFQQGHSISSVVRHLPAAERELLSRDQILAVLVVPIFVDDRLWGSIGFDDCHRERQWTASEESILVAIAASLGGAIKRQQTEAQMRYQAFHDALTGLPNRSLFDYRLNRAIEHARRTHGLLGVVFLDLDRFKTINDTLGHAVGDQLLQQATQRLATCLREEDCIARWGGDEFTLMLPNLNHPDDAAAIAQRISDALKPVFRLDHHELYITSSIGIALYPHNGQDAETLLKNADAALYRAKEQGRNNYQFYSHAINPQASQLLTLDHSLHQALDRNEFIVFYQPQFNVATGQITQLEALVRWKHPQLGLVSPATFITLAEENGLIIPIGEWVLRAACTQTKVWQAFGLPPLRVAVNLSARQFQQANLVERIAQILHDTGVEPALLELEVTETAAMRDVNFTIQVLHELRAMGVRIAMDDFGTGYSSLSYLKKFPLHTLKIDRSFVQDLADNPSDTAIVSAVITLGHGLNLSVVAEGVETQAQAEQLRSLNCIEMQGYWFGKPLDAQRMMQFLQQHYQPLTNPPDPRHSRDNGSLS